MVMKSETRARHPGGPPPEAPEPAAPAPDGDPIARVNAPVPVDERSPDETLDPAADLAELLRLTMRRLRREMAVVLAPHGLSASEAALVRLLRDGPLRMSAIAERLMVVPRTATDIVDAGERTGIVARRPDPEDRRSTLVELTPSGRQLIENLGAARRAGAARLFGGLSNAERVQLARLLSNVCSFDCSADAASRAPDSTDTRGLKGGAA